MSRKAENSVAGVFFALGDHTRLALLSALAAGALSATALASGVPVTRQAVAKHLHVLESAGLISHRKYGREVVYTLDPGRLVEVQTFLAEISADWDRAIARLRSLVEE